jgi:hypothetical protein
MEAEEGTLLPVDLVIAITSRLDDVNNLVVQRTNVVIYHHPGTGSCRRVVAGNSITH